MGFKYLIVFSIIFFSLRTNAGLFGNSLPANSVTFQSIGSLRCPLLQPDKSEVRKLDYLSIFKPSNDHRSYNYGYYAFKHQSKEAIDIFKAFFSKNLPDSYSYCESVECLLERALGNDWPLYVYFYLRYNINISPFAVAETEAWSRQDLFILLQTIQNLPKFLFPQPKTLKIVHQDTSLEGTSHRIQVAAYHTFSHTIKLNSLWDNQYDTIKTYFLTHEIAHSFGHIFNLHYSQNWLAFSDWQINRKGQYEANNKKTLTSRYSKTDPAEDFAEAFAAFRYNPSDLLTRSPQKFEYLKNVLFGGLSFDNRNNCQDSKSFYQSAYPNEDSDKSEIDQLCEFDLIKYRARKGSMQDYINCVDRNLFKAKLVAEKPNGVLKKKYEDILNSMKGYPDIGYMIDRDSLISDLEFYLTKFY